LVENFRPDVKNRLGIDYESLSLINPRLVYGSISGFGQTGPYRDRPGYDQIAQGMGGLMSVTGLPGQGPVRAGIPIADLTAGLFLAQGILVALLEREQSGRGQWVHTSLLQAMVTMMDFQSTRWLIDGVIPPQAGNDHPTGIPTGVFKTSDGHINIAASGQRMFRRLCIALGIEAIADDPRFLEPSDRSLNRQALTIELEKVLQLNTSESWVELLNSQGVPAGLILNMKQVFENEQVQHLDMSISKQHPKIGDLLIQGFPYVLSRTPGALHSTAPDLGEHTSQILQELGFTEAEISQYREDHVI
jgi:crotonobetainyl-CoA:carnitine CoA-transferase CaiB-like acyl-CoA transferase